MLSFSLSLSLSPSPSLFLSSLVQQTTLVLAGDPKQLGPVIQSPLALSYGLSVSLLERLISPQIWDDKSGGTPIDQKIDHQVSAFGCRVFTLVRNYRSNVHILSLFNTLFYDNVLVPFADIRDSNRLANLDILPRPGVPILYRHTDGTERQDADSPSWYNMEEITHISSHVKYLINYGVTPSDIGVIAPYAKQVEKFRGIFRREYPEILVGTTEAFQGLEKRVILISTVRSSTEKVHVDRKFRLGFLSNPKRLNVSLSRPMELLIIVGNGPLFASLDQLWHRFLSLLVELNVYMGPPLPPPPATATQMNEKEKEGEGEGKGEGKEEEEDDDVEPMPARRFEI